MAEKSVQGLAALVLFDAKLMARTGFTSEIVTRQEVGGESSESIVDFPHRQGKCGCPGSASVCCCLLSWWRGGRRRPQGKGRACGVPRLWPLPFERAEDGRSLARHASRHNTAVADPGHPVRIVCLAPAMPRSGPWGGGDATGDATLRTRSGSSLSVDA